MSETVRYMLMSAGLNELSEEQTRFIENHPHPEEIIALLIQYRDEAMSKKTYTIEDIAKSFDLAMRIVKESKLHE